MKNAAPFQSRYVASVREVRGSVLPVDADNCIRVGEQALLALRVALTFEHPDERTYVAMVDGHKRITPKKECRNSEGRYFDLRYDLRAQLRPPSNTMRVIRLHRSGHYEVREIGIACQESHFFLTDQVVYEGFCYQQGSQHNPRIVVPRFDEPWCDKHWLARPWPMLVDIMHTLLEELNVTPGLLPKVTTFEPPVVHAPEHENEGVVVFFNYAMSSGVVLTNRGLAFVSYREVAQNGSVFRTLTAGERVRFSRRVATSGYAYPAYLEKVEPCAK